MKITGIKQQKRDPLLYSIFIDGKYSFSLYSEVLVRLNIKKGQEINQKELQDVIKLQQIKRAQAYAFLLLSYRDRSYKEIFDRLRRKKFEENTIAEVIKNLANSGYLNDYKFAINWINQRLKEKPRGKRLIRHELFLKGIDKQLIENAINEIFTNNPVEEIDLAKRSLEKRLSGYKKLDKNVALRRIKNFLLRRGFSYDIIQKILNNLFNQQNYSN